MRRFVLLFAFSLSLELVHGQLDSDSAFNVRFELFKKFASEDYSFEDVKLLPGPRSFNGGKQYREYMLLIDKKYKDPEEYILLGRIAEDFALNVVGNNPSEDFGVHTYLYVPSEAVEHFAFPNTALYDESKERRRIDSNIASQITNVLRPAVFQRFANQFNAKITCEKVASYISISTNEYRVLLRTKIAFNHYTALPGRERIFKDILKDLKQGRSGDTWWTLKSIQLIKDSLDEIDFVALMTII